VRDMSTTKHKGINHWLILDLIERRIRLHMQRIYEECGHAEGRELADWLKAQSEVLRTLNASSGDGGRRPPSSTVPDRTQREVWRSPDEGERGFVGFGETEIRTTSGRSPAMGRMGPPES